MFRAKLFFPFLCEQERSYWIEPTVCRSLRNEIYNGRVQDGREHTKINHIRDVN